MAATLKKRTLFKRLAQIVKMQRAYVNTSLLFLDECFHSALDLAALTGLLVPVESYAVIRDDMYQLGWSVLRADENIIPPPVELHASDLLRCFEGSREASLLHLDRVHIFESAVRIVNTHKLRIRRIAYTNRSEIASLMAGDPKLYGLTFLGMQFWLGSIMENTFVLPVMDGVPNSSKVANPHVDSQLIRAFASSVSFLHHFRASGQPESVLSVRNSINLGEPMFGDSSHSSLLQLVDIVSYMLLQIEKAEIGGIEPSNELAIEILRQARLLDEELVQRDALKMQLH